MIWIIPGANSIADDAIGSLSDSPDEFPITANPPIIIKIPEITIIIPRPFDGSFNEMKNAMIGKINDGAPKPIPLCMSSKGRNPC